MTGSTGGLGRRIAQRLADRGVAQRLLVRDPARAPELPNTMVVAAEYGDASIGAALAGVDTLLLISASETEDRVARHLNAVDSAVAAGVTRIVYTSFVGAAPDATFTLVPHHWRTEEQIRAAGVAFTFLRDNLYADVLPYFVGEDGALRGPAGQGRAAFVARDDIADAATTVLLAALNAPSGETSEHDGATYTLTGPESLSLAEVAEILTAESGRPIRYHPEELAQAYASRAGYGAPDWMVEGWVSTYVAIDRGELDLVTGDVEKLTGHPATSVVDFVRGDQAGLARLRSLGAS